MRIRLMAGTVVSTFALALGAGGAFAQTSPAPEVLSDDERDLVTITATRVAQSVDEVPATVSVIDAKKIEDELVTDIKDLVRFEPGVSVRSQPGRFGAASGSTGRDRNSGFNIRGLDGNRVLVQVDGVRVPDGYSFGPTVNGRGDYVDLDLLKSVEILRGPASALYGSDGVAGAVSFITRDPEDLVKDGNTFGLRARHGYSSADTSNTTSLIGATEYGDWSAMAAWTGRQAHDTDTQGTNNGVGATRTAPNPSDYDSDSYLAKIVWAPGDTHRFRLTYDALESRATADIFSGRTASVLQILSEDTTERERISFDHEMKFGDGFWRSARWAVYTQDSDTRQFTYEDRHPAVDRTRDNYFDNEVWGANGQIEFGFDSGFGNHRFLAGADYSELEQDGIRSGTVPTPPDTFPARAFPLTEYTLTGAFIQDQITFLDGALTVYPALRYDAYELTPKADPLYPTTVPIAPSDGDRVTPRIGVVAWPLDWLGGFVNYAEGYKAPEPSQVNNAFSNLAFGYTSAPNPDLKPESSKSWEAGIRLRDVNLAGAKWAGEIVAYTADHDDFISQEVVSGAGTPSDPLVFQWINIRTVELQGVEAKASGQWDNGFGLRFAASLAEGKGRNSPTAANLPYGGVDPYKIVTGLTYDDPAGAYGGQFIVTYVGPKEDSEIAENTDAAFSNNLFKSPAFATLDLTAYWNITDMVTLRGGAFNITDEKYWWWSDVRGVAAYVSPFTTVNRNPQLDAYTQPGANYSVSLTFKY